MSSLEEIKRDFLLEGLEDWVGLWEFGPSVRYKLGIEDLEEVKSASLELVRELVGDGLFVPGELVEKAKGGFRPWDLGPEDSIRAIEELWDDLGREPNLGDDAPWFYRTEKGERVAQEHKRGS